MTPEQVALPPSSLIICTRNRPALLQETIASVLRGSAQPSELIVIDQSDSPNNDVAQLRHPTCDIRYISSKTIGLSRSRNIALSQVKYDLLVVLDDDMLAPEAWYATLLTALITHGPHTIVTGRILPFADQPNSFAPSVITSQTPQSYAGRIWTDPLFTSHMALYRSAAQRIGAFDERLGPGTPFPAAEDNDFGYRALQAGYVIQYVPEAMTYHREWRHKREHWALRWAYGRGQGAYYAKYIASKDSFILRRMSRDLASRIAQVPLRLFTKPWWAASDMVYACALLSGAAEWVLRYGRR